MKKLLLHTPEGVRDIYGEELARKEWTTHQFQEVISSYGYKDIQTPTFEYFDVFSNQIGTTPSKELFKFFDKDGNTLVLRPDFTPAIARCASKYHNDSRDPVRLSYAGNTFTNMHSLQGKLNEVTQMGAELINDGSAMADAEIIHMLITALLRCGLQDFQISIGMMDYYRGLCQEAGLDEDTELALRDYVSTKNYLGAQEVLDANEDISAEVRQKLLNIYTMYGDVQVLHKASEEACNEQSRKAIARLLQVYEYLEYYKSAAYVQFDLGMLSKYKYYTGIIFKAYTYGAGDAIAKGGRYDNLLSQFGTDKPAIGFAVVIDDLMAVLARKKAGSYVQDTVCVAYTSGHQREAIECVEELRMQGKKALTKCYDSVSSEMIAEDKLYYSQLIICGNPSCEDQKKAKESCYE